MRAPRLLLLTPWLGLAALSACKDKGPTIPPVQGEIAGSVTVSGQGIAGIEIRLTGPASGKTATSSSGSFSFTGLVEGVYQVQLAGLPDTLRFDHTSVATTITAAAPFAQVTFQGRLPSPGRLQVTVLRTGTTTGVAGARVEATRGPDGKSSLTGVDGVVSFDSLRVGDYSLRVVPPSGFEVTPDLSRTVSIREAELMKVDLSATPILRAETTVRPGAKDTVSVLGATLVLDGSSLPTALRLIAELPDTTGMDWQGIKSSSVPVSVSIFNPSSPSPPHTVATWPAGASQAGITMHLHVPAGSPADRVNVLVDESGTPVVFSVGATAATFVDPVTGAQRTTALVDLPVPGAGESFKAAFAAKQASSECAARTLSSEPSWGTDVGAIPLILVHGWQIEDVDCESVRAFDPADTWSGFLDDWATRVPAQIRSKYRVLLARYPSYESVAASSSWLADTIEREGLQGAVLVGHSMGGLVARGALLALAAPSSVRAVVTLGTPHSGSPLAKYDATQLLSEALVTACRPSTLLKWVLRSKATGVGTAGFLDLHPDSEFLKNLGSSLDDGPRIYTFAGASNATSAAPTYTPARGSITDFFTNEAMEYFSCAMQQLEFSSIPNDGVVPVSSAAPGWTAIQRVYPGLNHVELHSDRQVLGDVATALESLLTCTPAPAPPTTNAFTFTASVARRGDRDIDVLVNAIIVDGKPVTGLSESNFVVVEDGCSRPFSLTTAEGSLGVDIAFAQDLSGSMGGAVTGVRNSVISFTDQLRAAKMDVRVASVGYSSASSTIPSTPGPSTHEFLGPTHDVSDVTFFQAHVRDKWRASGGGDTPENGLEALEWAHHNLTWRAGAARVIINITDASHHQKTTNCNGRGPCTDQDLASILKLLGGGTTVHAVADSRKTRRTEGGGVDPWEVAEGTGGKALALVSSGVDLGSLGIAEVIREVTRITFQSASAGKAVHHLRVRVEIDGKVAELAPGAVFYAPIHPSLRW